MHLFTCGSLPHPPASPPPLPAQTSILNPKPVALTSWTSPLGRFQGHLRGTMSQAKVTIAPQTLLPLQLLCLLWGKSGTFTRDDAWIPSPPPSKLIFNSVDLAALCFPPAQSQSARFPTTRVLSPAQITPVDSCMASETPFHPFLDSAFSPPRWKGRLFLKQDLTGLLPSWRNLYSLLKPLR